MTEITHERDPQKTVLQARARMLGKEDTAQARQEMRSQALGDAAGMALYLSADPDDMQRLYGVYARLTTTEHRYSRLVLGKSLHAKCAKIEMMPERLEARADDTPDHRSEDERHRDAVNAWERWRGYVGQMISGQQNDLWAVIRGRVEPIREARVTKAGLDFVAAVGVLADIVDRDSGTF